VSSSTIGALASEEIEQASVDPPRSEIPQGTTVLALPTGAPWTDLNPKPDLPTEHTALQTADIARRLMRGGELHQRVEGP
jgi:hypothetical protein